MTVHFRTMKIHSMGYNLYHRTAYTEVGAGYLISCSKRWLFIAQVKQCVHSALRSQCSDTDRRLGTTRVIKPSVLVITFFVNHTQYFSHFLSYIGLLRRLRFDA